MSQGAKSVALRCPGTGGDPLCRHNRIIEGLDIWWHGAGTNGERGREREREKERNVRLNLLYIEMR